MTLKLNVSDMLKDGEIEQLEIIIVWEIKKTICEWRKGEQELA